MLITEQQLQIFPNAGPQAGEQCAAAEVVIDQSQQALGGRVKVVEVRRPAVRGAVVDVAQGFDDAAQAGGALFDQLVLDRGHGGVSGCSGAVVRQRERLHGPIRWIARGWVGQSAAI